MRFLLFTIFLTFAALVGRAEVPALLDEALQKTLRDTDRWAFTQTWAEFDGKGKELKRAVVRFDPSKPYAEQYTPLSVDGKPPTEGDFRKYRRRGEKRGERAEKAEREGAETADKNRQTLGELMDIERATLTEEDATTITYEVPLKKEGNDRLPPEKFLVTARVNKVLVALESVSAKLRSPLREKIVIKVSAGEGHIEFKTVDPKHPPQLSEIRANGSGSIIFVPIGRSYELRREDYKRVKPFGDRFEVQIGALKAIDF